MDTRTFVAVVATVCAVAASMSVPGTSEWTVREFAWSQMSAAEAGLRLTMFAGVHGFAQEVAVGDEEMPASTTVMMQYADSRCPDRIHCETCAESAPLTAVFIYSGAITAVLASVLANHRSVQNGPFGRRLGASASLASCLLLASGAYNFASKCYGTAPSTMNGHPAAYEIRLAAGFQLAVLAALLQLVAACLHLKESGGALVPRTALDEPLQSIACPYATVTARPLRAPQVSTQPSSTAPKFMQPMKNLPAGVKGWTWADSSAGASQVFRPVPRAVDARAQRMPPPLRADRGDSTSSKNLQMKQVGVGVIGAGRIGLVHLEALASCPGAKAIIISNPTVSKAETAAAQFNVPEFSGNDMDVINHPDVEAVWICSPSSFHADQIKACAAAGKHVFCEKPIATGLAETIEAINACESAGVKLMTALQRRFDPNFSRVRSSLEKGDLGTPIQLKLCSRDPAPPPAEYVKGGGGIFADMAVHDLDMARFLMGEEPEEILAYGTCNIDPAIKDLPGAEAYDTASIMIKFPGGKHAFIDVCRQAPYGYDQRCEVLGTKGMMQTDNMYPNTARIYTQDFTGNADMPYDFFMSRYKEAYIRETNAFIEALNNDMPAPCDGQDGLSALIMAIAAAKSADENRWVKFSEIPGTVRCSPDGSECELMDTPTDIDSIKSWEQEMNSKLINSSLKNPSSVNPVPPQSSSYAAFTPPAPPAPTPEPDKKPGFLKRIFRANE